MCGISGFFYFDGRPASKELAQAMANTQKHRGPDEAGVYVDGSVALSHRRLSIIDLSSGQQPLCNEDQTVWISFNGEIYNYQDLSRELLSTHRFRSRSDTETIVHLYESCPNTFVSQLRGMFAFALWDAKQEVMILARDRVGKKPLYYYADEEKFVFGSEIKAILIHPDLQLDVDDQAVSDYLSLGYVPAPKSIYSRIRKVLPGHFLKVQKGKIEQKEYWDLRFIPDERSSESAWIERFVEEFKKSVEVRLMSEVPLGAFLSGGLDSSAVVALMSRVLRQPVKTATIAFNEDRFDESDFARRVSHHLGTDHYEKTVTPDKIHTIEKLAWHYDEPFADSSALPTYFVSQIARERVTVCLSGDGGDENFAGYRRYLFDVQENRLRALIPAAIRRPLFRPLAAFYPKMDWAPRFLRAKSTFQSLAHDAVDGYFETVCFFREYEKPLILSDGLRERLHDYETVSLFREYGQRSATQDPLSRIQYIDIKTYLADDILTKVDRASMANSLEVRCPLLDHRLMELIATIPTTLKLRGRVGKYLLKKAMEPLLPKEIIYREKMGFGVPLGDWFRDGIRDFAHHYIIESVDPYLSKRFVSKMWEQHQSGLRDRSAQLWSILMFRLWHQREIQPWSNR